MALFDLGQGLSAAGYGAADLLGKQAIIQQQNDAEFERSARLETLKRAMDIARDFTIMSGGSPNDAIRAMQSALGGSVGGGVPQAAVGGQPAVDSTGGAIPQSQSAQPPQAGQGGAAQPVVAAAPAQGGAQPNQGDAMNSPMNAFSSWAKKYNVPEEVLRSAYVGSGMRGVAEILAKRGIPNMKITDGYAYDENKLQPGFTPGVTQAADGTTTLRTIDPNTGLPIISSPQGAYETKAGYTTAAKRAENRETPLPPTYVDRSTGLPVGRSLDEYLHPGGQQQGAAPGSNAIPVGNGVSITPEMRDFILADAQKNGITNPTVNFHPPAGYKTATLGMEGQQAQGAQQSGGVQLQGPAEAEGAKVTATKAAESGQAYKDALDSKVEEEFQLVNRNKQIMPLLDKFTTGGLGAEARLQIGNTIQNTTMLPDALRQTLATWVANGDPTAGKVLQNQLASAGILTMLQTLDKEGKPNRAIFQAVQKAQEGLESGNTTLKDVFELQKRLYQIHFDEQQALTKSIKSGSYDPRTWPGDYAAVRNQGLNEAPAPLPSATPPVQQPSSAGPVRITGNSDYNALPSGTMFIGPDGVQRRKP